MLKQLRTASINVPYENIRVGTSNKPMDKFNKVMKEYKRGDLHSGSKSGPKVTNPKQAVAIAYSERRRAKDKALSKRTK